MSTFNLTNYDNSNISNALYTNLRGTETNFVLESINFINKINKEYHNANRQFYIALYEAGNNEYIIENTFENFFNSVNSIIEKFLAFIKSIFDKFISLLHKLAGKDSYITKNKEKLKSFNSDCNFNIDGFKYSFSRDIPMIQAKREFDNDLTEAIKDGKSIKQANEDFINKLNGGYFESFRAEVIKQKGDYINADDFKDILFEVYRSGRKEKESILINKSETDLALERFEGYNEIKKNVDRLKKEIEDQYKDIKNEFRSKFNDKKKEEILTKMRKETGSTLQLEDVSRDFDIFLKNKIDQIISMSNIHSLAFASKLDAIKECFKQDKEILYRALSKTSSVYESLDILYDENIVESLDYSAMNCGIMMEQSITKYICEESMLLKGDSDPVKILIIQEALIKNIRQSWNNLMQAIAKLFGKFVEFVNKHFSSNKTYLTKYKQIILEKPLKNNYTMYPYWNMESKLIQASVPSWNFNTMKADLVNNETFLEKYFKDYIDKDLDYKEKAKQIFRGGLNEPKEIAAKDIKMTLMYNFCLNYNSLVDKLKKDMDEIDKCSKETIKWIESASREQANTPQQTPNKPEENKEESKVESAYSFILNQYITEKDNTKPVKIDNTDANSEVAKAAGKSSGVSNMKNIGDNVEGYDKSQDIKDNTTSMQDIELAKRYATICMGFLGAKMQILQETYKNYMFVIREHIKSYAGEKRDDREIPESNETNKETKTKSDDKPKTLSQTLKDAGGAIKEKIQEKIKDKK